MDRELSLNWCYGYMLVKDTIYAYSKINFQWRHSNDELRVGRVCRLRKKDSENDIIRREIMQKMSLEDGIFTNTSMNVRKKRQLCKSSFTIVIPSQFLI